MNKIKFFRLTQGLQLKALAVDTGLSVGHLSHLENNEKQPSKSAMESIATALSRTVPEVFYSEYTVDDEIKLAKCGYRLRDGVFIEAVKEGGLPNGNDTN